MSSFAPQMALSVHDFWNTSHVQQDGLEREIALYLAEHRQLQASTHTPVPSVLAMARDATLSPPLGREPRSPTSTSSRPSVSWSDRSSVRQLASPKSEGWRSPSTSSTTPTSPSTSRKPSTANSTNSATDSSSTTKTNSNTEALPRCYAHNCRGRVFSRLANYKRHVRERERRIKVNCEFCMKSFSRRSNRDTHVQDGRCKILRSFESSNVPAIRQQNQNVVNPDLQAQRSLSPDPYQHQHQHQHHQYQLRQQDDFQHDLQSYTHMHMPVHYQQNMQRPIYPYTYDMGSMLMDEFGQDRRASFE